MTSQACVETRTPYKILFITDSLAFPRQEPELVMYDDTYIALLKAEFPECDVIHHGRGGATIVELFQHSAYYHETLRPNLVFLQSGIVDCAPRALTIVEQQFIPRLPIVGSILTALVKKYSRVLRKVRNITYTPIARFAEYVAMFETIYHNAYWIDILPVSELYEAKLEGVRCKAELYSAILRRKKYVSTEQFQTGDIMTDHHHLNCEGHRKMFVLLSRIIRHDLGALNQA